MIQPDPLDSTLMRLDDAEEKIAELRAEIVALRAAAEPTFPHGPVGFSIECRCGIRAQRWSQRVGEVFVCQQCDASWTIINDRGGYSVGR